MLILVVNSAVFLAHNAILRISTETRIRGIEIVPTLTVELS